MPTGMTSPGARRQDIEFATSLRTLSFWFIMFISSRTHRPIR